MTQFFIEKFYLFFQGVLLFQTFFLGILYFITKRKDILFYSIFLLLSVIYFFLNAPNTFFGLNDDAVFNSAFYVSGNIPLIIITNLFYILFLKVFFSEVYSNKVLDKIFHFVFLLTPFLIAVFFLCRYFQIETQPIFYFVNLLAAGVSIFIIIHVFRHRLPNTGWVAWGMVFNILGTALTILMIVLERYGVRNIITLGYPLIFMRIGILADMFFYQIALLKKWHYQEKQLVVEKLQSQLDIEKLRNKISGELHDDIGSTLSGIAMYSHLADSLLQKGDYKKAIDSVHVIQKSASEIVHKLGDLVWAINPGKDSFTGMLERIQRYGNEMCQAKNIKFYYSPNINGLNYDPGMEVLQHLYLVAKEAINNAAKYSDASSLYFSVTENEDILYILVSDNGCGFNADQKFNSNGIGNMRKRAEQIGASLSISSTAGSGTMIKLSVKITQ